MVDLEDRRGDAEKKWKQKIQKQKAALQEAILSIEILKTSKKQKE